MSSRKIIGIIGAGSPLDPSISALSRSLGSALISEGYRIICGGLGGVMLAVCQGAHQSPNYFEGCTIGVLPSLDVTSANPYVDIPIASGINHARNQIITASASVLVSVAGGAGTLSELAFAWQLNKEIIALLPSGGWSSKLAGKKIDSRDRLPIHTASTVEEVLSILSRIL